MNLINTLKKITKDRIVLASMLAVFVAGISFFIFMLVNSKMSDQLIFSRYTVYGTQHYYRDQWFYRIIISLFGLIIAFLHNLIIIKLYRDSSRNAALVLALFSVFVVFLAFSVMFNMVRIPN